MVYSSSYDVLINFTRDYDTIRQALYNVEQYDKVCTENMLQAAGSLLLTNWGLQNYNQVLVFTHCGIGLGKTSLQTTIFNLKARAALKSASTSKASTPVPPQFLLNDTTNQSWIPFSNLSKLSFICLGSINDTYFQSAIEMYQQFLDISGQSGELFIAHTESDKTNKNILNGDCIPTPLQWKSELIPKLIESMCDVNYKPFEAILNTGSYHKLESSVLIWPTPLVSYLIN